MSLIFDQNNGTVSLNKLTYAVNFIWGMAAAKAELKSILKDEAEQINTNLYCSFTLKSGEVCYGLADESAGHKKGMCVLPATIASCVEGSLLGCWQLDQGFWYVLAIDSMGMITTDKAIEGETAAFDSFFSSLRDMDWQNIFCPQGWNLAERTGDFLLEDIIRNKKIKIQLVSFRPDKKLFSGLLLLFILITLLVIYQRSGTDTISYKPEPKVTEKHNIFPGKGKIVTEDFILNCRETIFSKVGYAYSVVGYTPDSKINCSDKKVIFTLKKEYGSVDFLSKEIMNEIKKNDGELNLISDDKAEIIFPLKGKNIEDSNILNSAPDQIKLLKRKFDNTFLMINISETGPCGPKSSDEVKYDREFICHNFNFQFTYNPEIIIPLISRDNNIVVSDIEYDYQNSIWTLSGIYYGIQMSNLQ